MALYRPAYTEDESYIEALKSLMDAGYPPLSARLLVNRGIADPDSAALFLEPSIDRLTDPLRIPDMDRAVSRIREALNHGERITVYGDYDVDGVTASVLLYRVLKKMGANVRIYVPDRHSEGYGLHGDAIRTIAEEGIDLIVTVDCGIHAIPEARIAIECGVDLVITDHHECGEVLPEAVAVVNPKRLSEGPERMLAGVGVAAKLAQALGGWEAVERHLDLIGLGTIADIVPLVDENRIYAEAGIRAMNASPCPGLKALIRVAGLSEKTISAGHVGFALGPRLNAAGRMELASDAVNLLLCDDEDEAMELAEELDTRNRDRQDVLQGLVKAACEGIETQVRLSEERILVLSGEDWHKGVIGIAASRLTELYHRPAIMLSVEAGIATASARSIAGFDLYQALLTAEDLFDRFGGHPMAAGFTMAAGRIPELKERLNAYARAHLDPALLVPSFSYDATLTAHDIPRGELDYIGKMAPFGLGNPSPLFHIEAGIPMAVRTMGAEDAHIKMQIGLGQGRLDAVGFRMGEMHEELLLPTPFSMVGSLEVNEWMDSSTIQFIIRHMKRAPGLYPGGTLWIHRRLHDAFFQEILYNDAVSVTMDALYPGPEEASIGPMGSLLISYTLAGTAHWQEYLTESGLIGQVLWGLGSMPPNAVPGQSALIAGPDPSRIPVRGIGEIWLLEAEKPIWSWLLPREWLDKVRVCRCGPDLRAAVAAETGIDREVLTRVYKYLRGRLRGRWAGYGRLLDDINSPGEDDINPLQLLLALGVFAELGLIRHEKSKQGVRVDTVPDPPRRELLESNAYAAWKEWHESISA